MKDIREKIGRLVLKDGSVFEGFSFGVEASVSGEVVFNTGMVGYPESLSDPSYRGQILVFTYPMIGNYGVPYMERDRFGIERHFESSRIQVSGLIVSDYSSEYSHKNAERSLSKMLKSEGIPALTGIDTRALTKRLRRKGVMLGKIEFDGDHVQFSNPNKRNLTKEVSVAEPVIYNNGPVRIGLVDMGVKNSILRNLLSRGVAVIRFPWDYDFLNSEYSFDGLLISNGPGNPKLYRGVIKRVGEAMESACPTFGICMGHQLMATAAGAKTYKMKYGHRSQNQPVLKVGTKRCYITSQNHGYAVEEGTIPEDFNVLYRNLNNGTNEGIKHKSEPFISVQFHPEGSPGPVDTRFLFDEFLKMVKGVKR